MFPKKYVSTLFSDSLDSLPPAKARLFIYRKGIIKTVDKLTELYIIRSTQ
jgi:hypothetical protein